MSRLPGIAFLVVFGYSLIGVYPVQWTLRELAKQDMKAFIREGSARDRVVTDLSFALVRGEVVDACFAWEEKDEFNFDGAMYDVVGREVKNGVITFHCMSDQRETKLVAGSKAIDQANGSDRSMQRNGRALIKSISERYVSEEFFSLNILPSCATIAWPTLRSQADPGFGSCFTPPPRG